MGSGRGCDAVAILRFCCGGVGFSREVWVEEGGREGGLVARACRVRVKNVVIVCWSVAALVWGSLLLIVGVSGGGSEARCL